jgi:4'-phosphopantetheinyl transferase
MLESRPEVHVWLTTLDRPPAEFDLLEGYLSPAEKLRAARFREVIHQRRFATGRGLLRVILAHHLDTTPHEIAFDYNAQGKPLLSGSSTLCFNVSHSGDRVAFALAPVDVGIDIETLHRRHDDYGEIAARWFSSAERAEIEAAQPADAPRAFAACWTRKEAYIKAKGTGLSTPLTCFEVLPDEGPWWPVRGDERGWHVQPLPSATDHEAAVAVRDTVGTLRIREWAFA